MKINSSHQHLYTKLLANKTFEDPQIIKSIEKILIQQRGFIFKMPKPGSEVILLLSGGIDSCTIWGMLMEKYQLKVYPLFLNKGEKRKRKEERAVDFFANLYQQKYPQFFTNPVKQSILLPQKEIIDVLGTPYNSISSFDPTSIKGFNPATTSNIFLGSPGLVPFFGLFFARHLLLKESKKIKTIFTSVIDTDGIFCPSQTLTAIRSSNLAMCAYVGDYSYQFTSPCIEPLLGQILGKKDLIQWAAKHTIPIEKAWSCYRGNYYQCGECIACGSRKKSFSNAQVEDKTIYSHSLFSKIAGIFL